MFKECVKICGLTAGQIAESVAPLKGLGVDFDVKENCLDALVTMSSDSADRTTFETVKSKVYNLFSEQVYCSFDESLQSLAGKLLKMNGRTLAVAESLTGGEICSRLTEVAGISENFFEGVVCYNRSSKINRLGVTKSLLGEYGAVSRETAYAMVEGLLKPPVDIGLATTGLAGPTGDEGKPVGLVYIAVGSGDFITVFEKKLSGTRNEIRRAASNLALFYLVRYLRGDILML
ncbi:MAG: CinA family protein [Clostridia bacterium]|nr:CinA family protein [Clostridia bacterium]